MFQGNWDGLVHPDFRVRQEVLGLLVHLDLLVLKDHVASVVILVFQVHLDLLDHLVHSDPEVFQVFLEVPDSMVLRDHLVRLVPAELQVC